MNLDNGMTPEDANNDPKTEDDLMAVTNQELDMMKKVEHETINDRLRKTLLQKSVEGNYDLLRRLSRT